MVGYRKPGGGKGLAGSPDGGVKALRKQRKRARTSGPKLPKTVTLGRLLSGSIGGARYATDERVRATGTIRVALKSAKGELLEGPS